jgi:hypothetical protein
MPKINKNFKLRHAADRMRIITLAGLLAASSLKANATELKAKDRVEMTTNKQKPTKDKISTPIQINTQKDIEQLFDYALPIIYSELCLEEVPMTHAYDDCGKFRGRPNTICAGSTTAPKKISDYKKTDAIWYSVYLNQNTFSKRTYTYEEMLQLIIGWAKYRTKTQSPETGKIKTQATVLSRMFVQLKGVSLTPNEFAAIFCAVYNNENNISDLLPKIKANIGDKIQCANLLRTWWRTKSHNPGHKPRCLFESFVFLNKDNFCGSMLNMQAKVYKNKKGKWKGASCINAEAIDKYCNQTLTARNCTNISNKCKSIYLGVLYNKGGVSPAKTMNNLKKYFVNGTTPVVVGNDTKLMDDYLNAITLYNQGKYTQALKKFLEIQENGGTGADLLNDIALTCYKLKKYDKCIEVCKQVLKSAQHDEYAKATYNAGLAYEAKGGYAKALNNYQAALKYFNAYGIADADDAVDYESIYKQAIKRVQQNIKDSKTTSSTKATSHKTRGKTSKSSVLFLAGMAAFANKNRRNDKRVNIIKRTRVK